MLGEGPASLQCLSQLHLQQRVGSQTLAAWIAGELTREHLSSPQPHPTPQSSLHSVPVGAQPPKQVVLCLS